MKDTLLSIVVIVGILIASALITNWFASAMYLRCAVCGTLNARRRAECRSCAKNLRTPSGKERDRESS